MVGASFDLSVLPWNPQALVWSMAQGPVAGAIIVWRCSWVFGFADHMVSVLIHLLPGLAVLAHMQFRKPGCEGELIALPCKAPTLEVRRKHSCKSPGPVHST